MQIGFTDNIEHNSPRPTTNTCDSRLDNFCDVSTKSEAFYQKIKHISNLPPKNHESCLLTTMWKRYTFLKFSQALGNSSCLQTTRASLSSQESSHTVPQVLLKQTSTRPSVGMSPSTSLTSPSPHESMTYSRPFNAYTFTLRPYYTHLIIKNN